MSTQPNKQETIHRVLLADLETSAPEAKDLLLNMLNNRIDYHEQESFSLRIRCGNSGIDHMQARQVLQNAKGHVNAIIRQALQNGQHMNITGELIIELLDERKLRQVV